LRAAKESSSAGVNRSMKCRRTLCTLGRCVLDGAAAGGQKADHGAAAVGGVGFAADQPLLLHTPDLVGEPALLPLQEGTQFLRGHALPRCMVARLTDRPFWRGALRQLARGLAPRTSHT
jgi:hypothetical protein